MPAIVCAAGSMQQQRRRRHRAGRRVLPRADRGGGRRAALLGRRGGGAAARAGGGAGALPGQVRGLPHERRQHPGGRRLAVPGRLEGVGAPLCARAGVWGKGASTEQQRPACIRIRMVRMGRASGRRCPPRPSRCVRPRCGRAFAPLGGASGAADPAAAADRSAPSPLPSAVPTHMRARTLASSATGGTRRLLSMRSSMVARPRCPAMAKSASPRRGALGGAAGGVGNGSPQGGPPRRCGVLAGPAPGPPHGRGALQGCHPVRGLHTGWLGGGRRARGGAPPAGLRRRSPCQRAPAAQGACTFGPRLSDGEVQELTDYVLERAAAGWK